MLKVKKSEIEQLREEVEAYRTIGREMKKEMDELKDLVFKNK